MSNTFMNSPKLMFTSESVSESVNHGIGLGYARADCTAIGTALTAGPRDLPVTVSEIPFYKNGTCRA
jgi:glycine cleavage system aminomethyltransferase T